MSGIDATKNEKSNNNFDALRLLAAILVVFSHSFALTGPVGDPLAYISSGMMDFGRLAVDTFFIISGYLITKSWFNKPSWSKFLWSRFLRIVPGLAVVVLFTVFVIGPLVTTLPLADYFSSGATWAYLKNITVFGIDFYLPGVFTNNPWPGGVNGSLWTLPIEFTMYLTILALGMLGVLDKKHAVLFITLVSVFIFAYGKYPIFAALGPLISFMSTIGLVPALSVISSLYPIFFMMGALFYLYRDDIKLDGKPFVLLALLWCISVRSPYTDIIGFFCLPYIVLYLALYPTKYVQKLGKYGDFSYGVYIYAFPIQQSLAYFITGISPLGMFLTALPITLGFAFISWHLIESKALGLKNINFIDIYQQALTRFRVLVKEA